MGNEIQKMESFRYQIAIAETFEEMQKLDDMGAALSEFMRRQGVALDRQNDFGIMRIELEAKKGAWLDEHFPSSIGRMGATREPNKMPVGKKTSSRARSISKTEPKKREEIFNIIKEKGEVITPQSVNNEIKKINSQEKKEIYQSKLINTKLPEDIYQIIYADPPWKYDFSETENRKIENQYLTMDIDELCKMEIPKTTDNALLLLWATAPKLTEALQLINSWGFKYITHGIWDKEIIGMGYLVPGST